MQITVQEYLEDHSLICLTDNQKRIIVDPFASFAVNANSNHDYVLLGKSMVGKTYNIVKFKKLSGCYLPESLIEV